MREGMARKGGSFLFVGEERRGERESDGAVEEGLRDTCKEGF